MGPEQGTDLAVSFLMESLWQRVVGWWHPPGVGVGTVLAGRYVLERVIGKGISQVYAARDLQLGGMVAIKLASVLAPGGAARLREEARAAMQLQHPGIVRVHTWDQWNGWEFLVMELVVGEDLGPLRVQHQTLTTEQVIQLGCECLDALAYAHRLGVVHNDIKPQNILLCHGHVKLVDFGLVSWGRGGVQAPAHTGSPPYMCPERLRGEPGDTRSDLYALAATLYTLAAGRTPFGDQPGQVAISQIEGIIPPISGVPVALQVLLARALALNPAQRPQTAEAFREALWACRPVGLTSGEGELGEEESGEEGIVLVVEDADLEPAPRLPKSPDLPPDAPVGMAYMEGRWIERQGQQLRTDGFFIDKTPVTNKAYQEFLLATGEPAPHHWLGTRIPSGKESHPVVGVSAHQARRYAAWRGVRLPTSSEWLAATPPPPPSCEQGRCQCIRQGATDTAPVGAHILGDSPEGITDLLGNVWEWAEIDSRVESPEPGCAPALGGSFRVACEGGKIPLLYLREAKDWLHVGFRCARGLTS